MSVKPHKIYLRKESSCFIGDSTIEHPVYSIVGKENRYAEIIDNKISYGFSLLGTFKDYYGNIHIYDPRGFLIYTEISVVSYLIDCCTITRGIIQDPCAWVKDEDNFCWLEPYRETK